MVALRGSPTDVEGLGLGLFIAMFALITMFPVPKLFMTIAGGATFGVAVGVPAAILGATLGSTLSFAFGRAFRPEKWHAPRLEKVLDQYGTLAVIGLRLIPVVPGTVVSYGGGLTNLRWRAIVIGTAVGIAPASVVYTTLGAYGTEPGSWPFLLALGGAALLAVGSLVAFLRNRARRPTDSRSA